MTQKFIGKELQSKPIILFDYSSEPVKKMYKVAAFSLARQKCCDLFDIIGITEFFGLTDEQIATLELKASDA